MHLLNLSIAELATALTAISTLLVVLYALRHKYKRVVVPTLRFWDNVQSGRMNWRSTRIQQPWSLALILLATALLLFAIARPQWNRGAPDRFHVLIVDTSTESNYRLGPSTVLEREKSLAARYLQRMRSGDHAVVLASAASSFPVGTFVSSPDRAIATLAGLRSSPEAWDAKEAFALARELRATHPGHEGEIVYVGPMYPARLPATLPQNVRVLATPTPDNTGISELAAEHKGDRWLVHVVVTNQGRIEKEQTATTTAGQHSLHIPAHGQAAFNEVTGPGLFKVSLPGEHDAYANDDEASLTLPEHRTVRLLAWTERPSIIRSVLGVSGLSVETRPPSTYVPTATADVVLLDGFDPAVAPRSPQLVITSAGNQLSRNVAVTDWTSNGAFTGLADRDFRLSRAWRVPASAADEVIASAGSVPVVVAHNPAPSQRSIRIGFDPFSVESRVSLTDALLLSRSIHWLAGTAEASIVRASLPPIVTQPWTVPGGVHVGLGAERGWPGHVELWPVLAAFAVIVLSLEWALFNRRRDLFRFAVIACTLIALLAPGSIRIGRHRTAVTVLVDRSASVTPNSHAEISKLRADIQTTQHFGSKTETNIERALATAVATAPEGYAEQIVLASDGSETAGSAARTIAHLQSLRIPVDVVPPGNEAGAIRVDSVSGPTLAFAHWPCTIEIKVVSAADTDARLIVHANGTPIADQKVRLHKGRQSLHVQARMDTEGTVAFEGSLELQNQTATFQHVTQFEKARAVILGDEPQKEFERSLAAAGFSVSFARNADALSGNAPQLVVLNNLDLQQLPPSTKTSIAQYVKDGGGLLLLGGEHQTYRQQDRQPDALEMVLPGELAPPEAPSAIAVVLVVDKSSSMEGRKIELARLSASAVVDRLKPEDQVGVVMFDNSFEWVVPLRTASDKPSLKRAIASIAADGGTQIAPALAEAYRRIQRSTASTKHIILLTDGISEEGDSLQMARDALFHGVTISTVGLGMDVNKSYLQHVADGSGGTAYFLHTPDSLREVVLQDIKDFSGKTVVERDYKPVVLRPAELLRNTGLEQAPSLKGYARYQAKPDTETLLTIGDRHDPLYMEWQYGLGRAAIFASDVKNRWAANWVAWKGYDQFWQNVSRHLAAVPEPPIIRLAYDRTTGRIKAETDAANASSDWYIVDPARHASKLRFVAQTPDDYEAALDARGPGLYRVVDAKATGTQGGIYLPGNDGGIANGTALLHQLAQETGGVFNPQPGRAAFSRPAIPDRMELWPLWLSAALVLLLADVYLRRTATMR